MDGELRVELDAGSGPAAVGHGEDGGAEVVGDLLALACSGDVQLVGGRGPRCATCRI
jgi:hypothetical protein